MKKIIITEKQLDMIVTILKESHLQNEMLKMMVEDLDLNYEPAMGVEEMGNQFYNKPMISKKVSGDNITPRELFDYLKGKFNASGKFTKQVIVDWYRGNLKKGGGLTKNAAL